MWHQPSCAIRDQEPHALCSAIVGSTFIIIIITHSSRKDHVSARYCTGAISCLQAGLSETTLHHDRQLSIQLGRGRLSCLGLHIQACLLSSKCDTQIIIPFTGGDHIHMMGNGTGDAVSTPYGCRGTGCVGDMHKCALTFTMPLPLLALV